MAGPPGARIRPCQTRRRTWTPLHDPLAVLAPFVGEAQFWDATLTPRPGGGLIKFASPARRPVKICLKVNVPAVKKHLYDALRKVL